MTDRISRRTMKHDKFDDEMGTAFLGLQKNSLRFVGAVAALVALAAIAYGVSAYRNKQEAAAQARLSEGIEIMQANVSQEPATRPGEKVYKTEEEKIGKAEPVFKEVASKYKGRDAGDVAELYLANIAASRGDLAGAKSRLEAFLKAHPDHILAKGARMSLYEIRLASNRKDVVAELEKELKADSSVLPKEAILALLARSYESEGNHEKARENYQRLVSEFPESAYAIDAQRKVSRG